MKAAVRLISSCAVRLGGARLSSQFGPDPVSDLRRSPMCSRRIPFDSQPSTRRSRRTPRSVVRPTVDGYRGLTPWRFGRVYLARRFKRARDFDAEFAQNGRAGLVGVVVDEDIVAVRPQTRLAANELPDLAHRRPPCRGNLIRRDLAPDHGQLARVNSLYVDRDRHASIVNH